MTEAIIFDLDSCIAAADEVGQEFFAPVFGAIEAANVKDFGWLYLPFACVPWLSYRRLSHPQRSWMRASLVLFACFTLLLMVVLNPPTHSDGVRAIKVVLLGFVCGAGDLGGVRDGDDCGGKAAVSNGCIWNVAVGRGSVRCKKRVLTMNGFCRFEGKRQGRPQPR
jgi:hypothetical protein